MATQVKERFEVAAPIDEVWAYFSDPPQVVPCMPGAELVGEANEMTYGGKVSLQVGPVRAQFAGTVRIESLDAEQHRMSLNARGMQKGATGRAEAKVEFGLEAVDETTTAVNIEADISIAGKLAQMGGGMIQTVSKRLFRKFSECIREEFTAEDAGQDQAS